MHSRGIHPPEFELQPTNYTPKLVQFGPHSYCKLPATSQVLCAEFQALNGRFAQVSPA